MNYPPFVQGRLIERLNRFVLTVEVEGKVVLAALPNTGRLKELLVKGAQVMLIPSDNPARKTAFSLALVRYKGRWVSLNSHLANDLFGEAINKKRLKEFAGTTILRREVTIGNSRLDFLLEKNGRKLYVEVKSVTLVTKGQARFPDAPTIRGTRHLNELVLLVKEGHDAAAVFVIQRNDAKSFTPNKVTDKTFAKALLQAKRNGVKVFAFRCAVGLQRVYITRNIPVIV
jgi:sugar fermentation stimulation protein A